MTRSSQSQKSGDNSTNTQIATQYKYGLTYDEARQAALDVFKANFYDLHALAKEVAEDRARAITEETLKRIFENNQEAVSNFSDPDIAAALLEAQKSYARSGDDGAKNILVELLAQRTQSRARESKNILLNEAIRKIELLGPDEIELIGILHVVISMRFQDGNPKRICDSLTKTCDWVSAALPIHEIDEKISILEYTGVLNVRAGTRKPFHEGLHFSAPNTLTKGISTQAFDISNISNDMKNTLWFPYAEEGDQERFAVKPESIDQLPQSGWSDKQVQELRRLNEEAKMNISEVRELLVSRVPNYEKVANFRDNGKVKSVEFSPVGVLIAEAIPAPDPRGGA